MGTKQRRSLTAAKPKITIAARSKRKTPRAKTMQIGNGHWAVEVTRNKPALISEALRPCHLILQNHGPAMIKLVANDGDLMDLPAGALRARMRSD